MATTFRSVLLRGGAALGVAFGFALSSTGASACGIDPYIGEVCFFAGTFCPDGYLAANGQELPVNNYQALFSLLGANYGGDGRTKFNLPDLQGRVPVGAGRGVGLSNYNVGQKGGVEKQTLLNANLPATMAGTVSGLQVQAALPVNSTTPPGATNPLVAGSSQNYLTNASAAGMKGLYTTTAPVPGSTKATMPIETAVSGGTIAITGGGGQPVNIVQPYQAMTACIANVGTYPMRP